ncbi:SAM-dependent methyltransferase [Paenibacillus sp. 1001270B_150601_E10]|uniref:SAM-dependent methyltransferase n=1 Tax=Paenibacillus sp. 1001270B_150601_E10 TaxID=2787079 RepID=UPI001E56F92A|nr:SAM-dependent methyltransferase [Paenibacillus sp. 1001270B_150601_E10]
MGHQGINISEVQLPAHFETSSHWIITANHGFIPYAQEELRRTYGKLKSQILVTGEVALMELPNLHDAIWEQQRVAPSMFVRDMFPVLLTVQNTNPLTLDTLTGLWEAIKTRSNLYVNESTTIAIHTRKSQKQSEIDLNALRLEMQQVIEQDGHHVVVQSPHLICSVYEHEDRLYFGLSTMVDQGVDWPGGAIRFQREDGQISRAKFKLLEAEQVFGIDFSQFRHGLDIGAAPGGWSSLLLERGLEVTAVDPAKMHESLIDHPQLTVINQNAGDVAFEPNEFDLLVCDMSWNPKHTAQLVIQLLEAVQPGGTVIVTVKLMHKKPLQTIKDCMEMFEQHLHILRAKQLFHNRDEITLYMIKY